MFSFIKPVFVACVLAVPFTASAELVSHRAAYGVSLASARDGVPLEAISGQIAYGIEKVCGGWLLAQSGTMNMQLPTGKVVPETMQFSSWESDDARNFRFTVKAQGDSTKVILGTAEIAAGGQAVASFSRPEAKRFDLPKGTLFPMAHTAFMIDAARAGKSQAESFIFEGTDVEGAKLLVAFISPLSDDAKVVMNALGGDLLGRPGWNYRLAYFDPQSQAGVPLYEVEVDLLDNGVAPRWVLDYGAYAVEMKLNKIEPMAKPKC